MHSRLPIQLTLDGIGLNEEAHIQLKHFGNAQKGQLSTIDRMLNEVDAMRSTDAEQITRAAYLTDYQLRDPDCYPGCPMDTVRLYHKTNTYEGGPLITLYRDFIRLGVRENCGITLTEWLELPWWIAQEVKSIAKHITETKATQIGNLKNMVK